MSAAGKAAKSRSRAEVKKPAHAGSESRPAASGNRPTETKQARVLGLLQREQGASLAELVAATGWLPHTTRAALTRLRQGGHDLQKEKRDTGETAYRIEPARVARARKAA